MIAAIAKEVISFEGRSCDEVIFHFVGNKKMCRLHADFFDDPSPTDCMSFPLDADRSSGYQILGEVFVCPQTAANYIAKNGGYLDEEITLYTVHGLLHLLGYDDLNDKDRLIMRKKEEEHMSNLRKCGIIPATQKQLKIQKSDRVE